MLLAATLNRRKGLTEPRREAAHEPWILAGHYDPDFGDAVCSELEGLRKLGPSWDCYGGRPIDPEIIAAACNFIRSLPENLAYRPRVVPMSPGNLQFEWHHGPKILELEFETPHTIHFLQWDPEKGVEEENVFPVGDVDRAVELIQWFMSGTCV